jgi:hypothetical protein
MRRRSIVKRFFPSGVAGALVMAALALRPPASTARSNGNDKPMMASFQDLKWTTLPGRMGMEYSILSGDPEVGAYTEFRKVLAGTDNPRHRHSSEIKNVIISGTWYTGADAASAKDLGPGSVVVMPADWVHVSGCRAGSDCVIYQEGKGKFDFKPVPEPAPGKP